MRATVIKTENLTRNFGMLCAVDNLSLNIQEGTVFGFIGPNGAGKTTTIRLLLGLLEPTSGKAEILDMDTRQQADNIRAATGVLFDHDGLYERLSAEDNLEFYGKIWHMSTANQNNRIKELLTHFQLYDRRKEVIGSWSKGMKRKLALVRAMLHSPPILFLDEPTVGLDPISSVALREDLATLATKEKVTIFLTTHNLIEAEKLCKEIGVIAKGKLAAIGTLDELRNRSGLMRVEIVGKGFNEKIITVLSAKKEVTHVHLKNGSLIVEMDKHADVSSIIRLIVNEGATIEEIHKDTLEQTFMEIMGAQQ